MYETFYLSKPVACIIAKEIGCEAFSPHAIDVPLSKMTVFKQLLAQNKAQIATRPTVPGEIRLTETLNSGDVVELWVESSGAFFKVCFTINSFYDFSPRKNRIAITKSVLKLFAEAVEHCKKNGVRELVCSPHQMDGYEDYRVKAFHKLGFKQKKHVDAPIERHYFLQIGRKPFAERVQEAEWSLRNTILPSLRKNAETSRFIPYIGAVLLSLSLGYSVLTVDKCLSENTKTSIECFFDR
jgi:hypothetical protein